MKSARFINLTECCGLGRPERVITVNISEITQIFERTDYFANMTVHITVVLMRRKSDSTTVMESREEILRLIKLAGGIVLP
jgi:hypothetical protein